MASMGAVWELAKTGLRDRGLRVVLLIASGVWGASKLYNLCFVLYVQGHIVPKLRRDFTKKRNQLLKYTKSAVNNSKVTQHERDIITSLSLVELSQKIKSGDISPSQALVAYQDKALDVHDRSNCLVYPLPEAERWAAEAEQDGNYKQGLLHGVPISVKESLVLKGHVGSDGIGIELHEDGASKEDCVVVKILKDQGAIPFVRTTVPMLSSAFHCVNRNTGVTTHPEDSDYIPGGSSSGEGALLGGGGSPLGIGTDIGGSVRNPAAWNGICTIKPTCQRISTKGMPNNLLSGNHLMQLTIGPMARNVDDVELAMKAICCDRMYELDKRIPPLPWKSEIYTSTKPLKIGYNLGDSWQFPVTPPCANVVLEVKAALEKKGHTLVPWEMPHSENGVIFAAQAALIEARNERPVLAGESPNECCDILFDYPPGPAGHLLTKLKIRLHKLWDRSVGNTIQHWALRQSLNEWKDLTRDVEAWRDEWEDSWKSAGIDAMICPAATHPPSKMHRDVTLQTLVAVLPAYAMANMLNIPAGCVPVRRINDKDLHDMESYDPPQESKWIVTNIKQDVKIGQPLGVQCMTLKWEDELCLRAMKEIESSI